jgi:Protein of unknown function (DUF1571)
MTHGKIGRGLSRRAFLVLLGLFGGGLSLVFGQAPAPPTRPGGVAQASANIPSPVDQPLNWFQDAKRNFSAVQDYTCTLTKRENINGTLSDEHIMEAKFRTQPYSVYMRWLAPSKFYGQEVAFIMGRNNNKMRVHSKGLIKGAIGFVSLDINDRRVLELSRHTIFEAGIGNLIDQSIKYLETERQIGKSQIQITEVQFDKRPCYRVELVRQEKRPQFDFYRTVFYLDKVAKLPVSAENYEWPRPGGHPGGDLVEQASFTNLRWNVGLTERDFNK